MGIISKQTYPSMGEPLQREPAKKAEVPLTALFKEKIGVKSDQAFQRIWNQTLAAHRIYPQKNSSEAIEQAIGRTLIYHGPGLSVNVVRSPSPNPHIHDIVQYLLGKGEASNSWVSRTNIKGVLFKQDPALLAGMEEAFRNVLKACTEKMPEIGSKEAIVYEAFIGNVVALLPYCYPKEGAQFTIPQKIDGQWKSIDYTVDRKIELTPRWFSSPITAYGLTATDAPPLLTFLGTTFPMGDGFLATLLSDFTPGLSVGHAPYLSGRGEITKWLEDKNSVRLFGMSLGGALAFHTLRSHGEKIERVDVYNPPGLYPWNWTGKEGDTAEVNIFYQDNDLVGSMGTFPQGEKVSIYRVVGGTKDNPLKAHARVYSGGDEVTVLRSSPSYENSRLSRKLLTALHVFLGGIVIFLPLLFFYFTYLLASLLARPFHRLEQSTH